MRAYWFKDFYRKLIEFYKLDHISYLSHISLLFGIVQSGHFSPPNKLDLYLEIGQNLLLNLL